ncbi:MAG: ParB/RepB/Spo0J family partition protein [Clostridia bacterium]|nr:ParB/RepB/Spo0J family partition protein [Clostridia bacterium]
MKKGLGKGLDALFEENSFEISGGVNEVRISDVEPDKNQPRREFEPEALEELSESIKQHGVISPIVVTKIEGDRYRIIAGERRWRASKLAGLEKIPVIVKEYSDQQLAEISLVENLQREDLNPLEEAFGYKNLMDTYNLTQEQVANKVSKSRSAVANAIRLLALPEQVLDFVKTGELSAGHARTLLSLSDPDQMLDAANRVIGEDMSVRQTEDLIKKMKTEKVPAKPLDSEVLLALSELENRARTGTGNKVKIKHTHKNNGKIEIFYNSTAELEKLIDMLS